MHQSIKTWIPYRMLLVLMIGTVVDTIFTDIVVQNISTSLNVLNITGLVGRHRQSTTVYNDSSTWYDARDKCEHSNRELELAPPNWFRWRAAAQYFRENNIPVNFTFWTGIYRPFEKSSSWYTIDGSKCIEVTNDVDVSGYSDDERCLSCRFVNLYNDPKCTGDACNNSFPYICRRYISNITINVYNAFTIESIPIDVTPEQKTNATSDTECAVECGNEIEGFAFTFNFTSGSCIVYRLTAFDHYVNYTIVRSTENVTHGVKRGFTFDYSNNISTSALTPDTYTMPQCHVDSVPRNYCLCEEPIPTEELNRIVDELIKNLTIDPANTSKNKQKYSSLTDDRPSSRVTGSLAACFIASVFAIPIVSDLVLLKQRWEKKKAKRKLKHKSVSITHTQY